MALPTMKRDASPELLAQVKAIESCSDKWSSSLALAGYTYDVAAWGILTQMIGIVEEHITRFGHGSQEQREAMINLGRAGGLLLDWLSNAKLPQEGPWRRWTAALAGATKEAVLAAHNYGAFVSCFTMWYRNRMTVEVLSPTHLRFGVLPSPTDRRIRAHQQGARIPGWPSTPDNPVDKSFVDDSDVLHLLQGLWNKVAVEGALAMSYSDDSELLSVLRDIYEIRLKQDFRRDPLLDLGGYRLGTFRRFFSALLSACTVHEYLSAAWFDARKRYPFESAVMVKSVADWAELMTRLTGIEESQIRMMIADLTFGATRPLDIYIHPFVPSLDGQTLFLVPHFILNSRAEENILRVCSYARHQCYSEIANAKEGEMRESIKASAPSRYRVSGPLTLPDPKLPDIDIVIKDAESSAVLIGELKWPRKTVRVLEHLDRDAELDKGFQQLRDVRAFLGRFPEYLQQQGVTAIGEGQPDLSYGVIARDHLTYIPQQDGLWLTEFDALIWALQNSDSLPDACRKLQAYDWLPVEGRDFTVRFEAATAGGVTIDSEVFHRPREIQAAGISA
ncbi:MAG: hypothetical protein WAL56_21265 [Candidatus Sulfotelmatobacter sp.]